MDIGLVEIDFPGLPENGEQGLDCFIILLTVAAPGALLSAGDFAVQLKAFIQAAMVGEYSCPFRFGWVGGEHQFDLHLWQGRRDLGGAPAAFLQLSQGISPQCRQCVGSGLSLDFLAKLVGCVLLGHAEQLKGNRIGLSEMDIFQRWTDAGELAIGERQASGQFGRTRFL